ncbi:TetR/AcrR family transcriptional regulator [Streptomyces marincola]|uniref:TetR/AcrR family transcriptional regulator n=1 Tax=Streptomyces marincola TaxID=2878388 RepID=UPI001CF3D043|nr:TetR/AcrR family transcriptional regulator [Streptomyces marincola]UCM87211.1 TetR/AcrR family transcriptional regulator [Streptomyces marincola]
MVNYASGSTTAGRRPRQRRAGRGDLREDALLAAAEDLLRETPPGRITVESIAAAAGLSRSSVYFYFDGKNAVVAAVVHRGISRMIAGIEDELAADRSATAGSAADRLIGVVVDNWRAYGFVFRAGAALIDREPAVREVFDALFDRTADVLAAAVRRDRTRGVPVAGPEDSDWQRARALACMAERSLYLLFTREHSAEDEAALADALTFLLRRGLGYA